MYKQYINLILLPSLQCDAKKYTYIYIYIYIYALEVKIMNWIIVRNNFRFFRQIFQIKIEYVR